MDAVETLARRIAARKMNLIKDPRGENLPDDLWRQAIPEAVEWLSHDHVLEGTSIPDNLYSLIMSRPAPEGEYN